MRLSIGDSLFILLAVSKAADARPAGQGGSWQDFFNHAKAKSHVQYENTGRAEAVKEAYLHSWNGYAQLAFGYDELRPVSKQPSNSRNGWGATIADALSTGILMEAQGAVDQQLDFLSKVNFTKQMTSDSVSLFETTIRYLGGLLAGYDLLKGPFNHLVNRDNYAKVDSLLQQAKSLATVLMTAYNTPSGLPDNTLYWTKGKLQPASGPDGITGLAVAGTLVLEWTHLSDLLGDSKFGAAAQKGENFLLNPSPKSGEPFPGLLGSRIRLRDGTFSSNSGSWGASSDSFYEYLIKMYAYDPSRFDDYRKRWIVAADSTMSSVTSVSGGHTFVAAWSGSTPQLNEQHLTCFIGGNFLLGGAVLGEKKYTDYGLAMTESCHATYAATKTHIGPETFGWDPKNVPSDQKDFFKANGFYLGDSSYNLRPEVVESYYYAYIATRDTKYQDWAWDAFLAINSTCRTEFGFSSINNVNADNGGGTRDFQESFWFAEVLKYFYLIFKDDGLSGGVGVSAASKQGWVFNTEAHPFAVNF